MGGKWSEKKNFFDSAFFQSWKKTNGVLCFFQSISPPCLGLFQSSKTESALDTPSCNFLEPGFWILTKGG